ncbi:TetR/AcrR family transcriptional regulator [Pseudonocardia sp. NPDC049635]|uniref:TetR/AcrR family transcriptional regulator n=1 Tax=Pseudonocardia sp. NPDC049635 TaxID=3155506 RepID=UPI0033E0F611
MDAAERDRDALLDAALQQWADGGWAAVDPVSAAERAGVGAESTREFDSGVDLACAVFDHVVDERAAVTLSAVEQAGPSTMAKVRAALEAFFDNVDEDPRRVVALVDAIGCPPLAARRRSANRGFAELITSGHAGSRIEPDDLRVAGHFCLGGLTEIILAWLDPDSPVTRGQALEHGVRLYESCMSTR